MVSKYFNTYLKVLNISFAIQITLFDVGMNEDGEMQFVNFKCMNGIFTLMSCMVNFRSS
jgi:hypothetical protein